IIKLGQIFHEYSYDELNNIYTKAMKALRLDDKVIDAQKLLTKEVFNHLLRNYDENIWVCQVKDRIIGFATALLRDNVWNIAGLYIDPQFQGKGYGKALIAELFPKEEHVIKMGIIPGSSSVAQTLFLKNGFQVQFSVFYLAGTIKKTTREEESSEEEKLSCVYHVNELSTTILESFKEIDKNALGFSRNNEHRFWFDQKRKLYLFREAGQVCGYGYVSESRVGPLVAFSDRIQADLLKVMLSEVKEGTQVIAAIPGSNNLAIEELLKQEFRVIDNNLFLSNVKFGKFETVILDSASLL
ncbi:MAG: GNAT family N-acetyltransferase, partial [Promethearchaeota archaeon]